MGDEGPYLLFVPSPQGYRIEERTGELPALGDPVELGDAGRFVVNRLGPSPYPADGRHCAYLLAAVA
jgi:hypothetical protein